MTIQKQAEELRQALDLLLGSADLLDQVQAACDAVVAALRGGHKILTCGNGGSATDASHLAEELIGRYRSNRRALPAVSLSADPSAVTCIANDFGFEAVFERQVQALGQPGDVLVAFTTSGQSANVNRALASAGHAGMRTVVLTGTGGGEAATIAEIAVRIPSTNTARIQELHTLVLHMICEACESAFAD